MLYDFPLLATPLLFLTPSSLSQPPPHSIHPPFPPSLLRRAGEESLCLTEVLFLPFHLLSLSLVTPPLLFATLDCDQKEEGVKKNEVLLLASSLLSL